MKILKFVFVAFMFGFLFLAGCVNPPDNKGNNTSLTNGSYVVRQGDVVAVNYVLRVDGKVYDTNIESVAKEAGIYNENRSYEPFVFKVSYDGKVIPGFVDAVIGMKKGETKNTTILPSRGYGFVDPSLKYKLPRYYNRSFIEEVPIEWFEQKNLSTEVGSTYNTDFGTVFVNNVTNGTVELGYYIPLGKVFVVNGLPQKAVNTTNESYVIEYLLDVNKTYLTISPITKKKALVRVVDKDDNYIYLDENHPLAGKNLDYTITLVDILSKNE